MSNDPRGDALREAYFKVKEAMTGRKKDGSSKTRGQIRSGALRVLEEMIEDHSRSLLEGEQP